MNRTVKLLLHAGTHKTGTTAIQHVLAANTTWLESQGVLYAQYPRILLLIRGGSSTFFAHNPIAGGIARHALRDRILLRLFQLQLHRSSRDKRWAIVSAESIYRHVVGREPQTCEEFYAGHIAYLQRVRRFFKDFEITLVLYFRRPDMFAVSRFKEHAVRGISSPDFGSFVLTQPWVYHYRKRVELFRRIIRDVQIRIYEAERRAGLVERFLEKLEVPSPPTLARGPVRASPTNRATLWLKRAQEESRRSWRTHERRVLFTQAPEAVELFAEPNGSTLWPSRSCFSAFVERNGGAYEFGGFQYPDPPDEQPAQWTDNIHRATEAAFSAWESKNRRRLNERQRLRLRFFEPYP